MTSEEKFFTILNTLARSANFELDQELIGIYDRFLSVHGYEKAFMALQDILVERNSRDPFPSVAEILRKMGENIGDKTIADDVCSRMLASMRKHGWPWPDGYFMEDTTKWSAIKKTKDGNIQHWVGTFKEAVIIECGELGWAVFEKMGGYTPVCHEFGGTKNPQVFRAQLREICRSTIELAKAGKLFQVPSLPHSEKLKELVDKSTKTLDEGEE